MLYRFLFDVVGLDQNNDSMVSRVWGVISDSSKLMDCDTIVDISIVIGLLFVIKHRMNRHCICEIHLMGLVLVIEVILLPLLLLPLPPLLTLHHQFPLNCHRSLDI